MVLAFVLAQAAIAGHACGMVHEAAAAEEVAGSRMPCADTMANATAGDEAVSVCYSHCQSSQGTGKHPAPHVADLSQSQAVLAVHPPLHARTPAPDRSRRRGAAGPPIAIAHCCFRI